MSRGSTSDDKVVYFADWNPDELSGNVLPLTKVGISSHPEKRISDLTVPPFEQEIVATIKTYGDARHVEDALHEQMRKNGYHVDGEWFSLPDSVIGWAERTGTAKPERIKDTEWANNDC